MFQPARHFFAETDRWFLWLPVGLGIGVGLYFSGQVEPPQWLGICLLVVLVAIGYVGRRTTHIYLISVGLGITALGFTAAQFRTAEVSHIVLAKKIGPTTVEGRVKLIETFTDGARLTLDNTRIHRLGGDVTPSVVRIRVKTKLPNLRPGDWITARASLRPPPPPAMPGSFDFQRQLYFKAIGATGFTYGGVKIVSRQTDAKVVSIWWQGIRHDLSTHIRESIGGSAGAIAAALITGDRGSIPKNVLTAFRQSGLAHLLAISGLHIGLVAGILLVGIRTILALIPILALRYPIKKWAAFLAISGAFGYAILAGATVPTQRAFVMVSLVLLAVILDRQGISMRLVAIAAGVILVFRPESLVGASFQLSFAAVIALIAGYEYWSERRIGAAREIRNRRGIWRPLTYLFGIASTTVIATLATSPFAVYHFNQVAVFGLRLIKRGAEFVHRRKIGKWCATRRHGRDVTVAPGPRGPP